MSGGKRRVVAVWRNLWLPTSETFVRNHVLGLRTWSALPIGLHRTEQMMGVSPERAPFANTPRGRLVARASRRLGHPMVYDSLMRSRGVSVLHAHFGTGAVEVLPVAKRNGLPLIVTFHGYDVNRAPLQHPTYLRRLRQVFEYATELLVVSDFLGDKLLQLGAPPHKVRLHYLGIPLPAVRVPIEGKRSGVLHVGRLVEYKGAADLMRAYALLSEDLRQRNPLTIVGDGPEKAKLEALADQELGIEASFRGTLSSIEVADLMASARIFAAPAKRLVNGDSEAFGLTMIEAASAGLPVVGYACGGALEAVHHGVTGLLAQEGDFESLARHLERLLVEEKFARKMGATGQQRVYDEFDLKKRHVSLERIYDRLAQFPPPGGLSGNERRGP